MILLRVSGSAIATDVGLEVSLATVTISPSVILTICPRSLIPDRFNNDGDKAAAVLKRVRVTEGVSALARVNNLNSVASRIRDSANDKSIVLGLVR
jgi:hypothetical protein